MHASANKYNLRCLKFDIALIKLITIFNEMFFKYMFTASRLLITMVVIYLYIHYFFPQSWGFYTVYPNVPLYDIYSIQNGKLNRTPLLGNNLSYGMGISRKGKLLYSEIYYIIIKKGLIWKPLIEDSINNIVARGNYISISTTNKSIIPKGKFLITQINRPTYLNLKKGELFQPLKQYILIDVR